jgi:hypothetical protein
LSRCRCTGCSCSKAQRATPSDCDECPEGDRVLHRRYLRARRHRARQARAPAMSLHLKRQDLSRRTTFRVRRPVVARRGRPRSFDEAWSGSMAPTARWSSWGGSATYLRRGIDVSMYTSVAVGPTARRW